MTVTTTLYDFWGSAQIGSAPTIPGPHQNLRSEWAYRDRLNGRRGGFGRVLCQRHVFTGLVQDLGSLVARQRFAAGQRLRIRTNLKPLALGESVAVDGVCLTVDQLWSEGFESDASSETCSKTTLGDVGVQRSLHLERALSVGDRLGGHWVTGHVDTTVRVLALRAEGESFRLTVELPEVFLRYVALKGSVALDGVSLTVNEVVDGSASVMLVPHTSRQTHLGLLAPGDRVNLEVDLLARYVESVLLVGGKRVGAHEGEAPADAQMRLVLQRAGILA